MRPPRRTVISALAALVLLGAGVAVWERAGGEPPVSARPQVAILIEPAARAELGAALDRYRLDAVRSLAPAYGPTVRAEVIEIDLATYFPSGSVDEPGQVRLTADVARELRDRYLRDGLVGIVVIGDIPLPRAYDGAAPRLTLYPWMDFEEPAFTEDPATGRFQRTGVRDPRPEVWSGVIRASNATLPGQPAPTLAAYFEKNHRAHTAATTPERRLLFNDLWGEEQLRDLRLPDGRVPTPQELPGGSELALRDLARRFAERVSSSGRYAGVNFAHDQLPIRTTADRTKTVAELLAQARRDGATTAIDRWKNGAGALQQADVASQVVLYFDRWTEIEAPRLDRARTEARAVVARTDFDLFSREGYELCSDTAPGGNGYFSLSEAQRAEIFRRSGFASRAEFEFLLRWARVYTDGEKRLSIVQRGIPPFGKYRGIVNRPEVRLTVASGGTAYELRGARLDPVCLTGGTGAFEVLLGAATARETSGQPPANLALSAIHQGGTIAALGNVLGPPADLVLPADLLSLDRAAIEALAARAEAPGFGRSAAVTSTAEGIGFEADPFLLAAFSGQPLGEAVRATFDEPTVLYGDPTYRLP